MKPLSSQRVILQALAEGAYLRCEYTEVTGRERWCLHRPSVAAVACLTRPCSRLEVTEAIVCVERHTVGQEEHQIWKLADQKGAS